MGDLLQPLAPLGRGEDDRAELLPVEGAVSIQDPATELGHDRRMRRLPRLHHVTRETVSVDDLGAEPTEALRHRALPGRDTAGEPDEQELPRSQRLASPTAAARTAGDSDLCPVGARLHVDHDGDLER